jgi:hypothetical protein
MDDLPDTIYAGLSPVDRFAAITSAWARDDEEEVDRLFNTAAPADGRSLAQLGRSADAVAIVAGIALSRGLGSVAAARRLRSDFEELHRRHLDELGFKLESIDDPSVERNLDRARAASVAHDDHDRIFGLVEREALSRVAGSWATLAEWAHLVGLDPMIFLTVFMTPVADELREVWADVEPLLAEAEPDLDAVQDLLRAWPGDATPVRALRDNAS